jgi:hypothetical protein
MASFPKEVGISDDVFSANGIANRRRGSQIAIKFRRENYSVLCPVWLDFLSVDLTHCPHCGGQLRIIAAIMQRQAIEKILNHLGLEAQPPPRAPARGQMVF